MSDKSLEWDDAWHTTCPHCSKEDEDLDWQAFGMPIDFWEAICSHCGTQWSYEMAIVNVKIKVPEED
jgi:hypothetical protein